MKDMKNFSKVNEVYREKFTGKVKPARQVVEVSALPKDAELELSCIAKRS